MKKIIVTLLLFLLMPSVKAQSDFNTLLLKAKTGDVKAQYQLVSRYADGIGVERNYAQAFIWLSLSTANEETTSRTHLAKGLYKNKDYAMYIKGMYCFMEENFDEAIRLFTQLENKGIAEASSMLAICYGHKDYEKCNYQKAVEKAQTVADKDALAQFYLANMCLKGRGLKKDTIMAMNYFLKASENGMMGIDGLIGQEYFTGQRLGKDYTKAVYYFQQAEKKNMLGGGPARFYRACLVHKIGVLEADREHGGKVAEMADNYMSDFYELVEHFYDW